MKKLFFAAFTAVLFLGACTQKKGLSGSEFTNPNILVAGAVSIWDDFVHQEDSVIEQERANAIAEYVKKHGLKAAVYQDYGWPVVPLKLD